MAAPLNLEDVIFEQEDALVTDEDLTEQLPTIERVFSQEEGLSREPSFNANREISRGLQSKMTGQTSKKRRIETDDSFSKIYYILAHGQLALTKYTFKSHCRELSEINHITTPGSILLTKIQRDKDGIKFPLLHHLCGDMESIWHDITEDFILSSSASTNDYDGVYLCIDGVAVRVIPFRDASVKVRLSTVVSKICDFNSKNFYGQRFKVKVLSCLKERVIQGAERRECNFKGLSHEDCKYLDLSSECSIKIGGKTKTIRRRRRKQKRSRKKLVQSYHRRG